MEDKTIGEKYHIRVSNWYILLITYTNEKPRQISCSSLCIKLVDYI